MARIYQRRDTGDVEVPVFIRGEHQDSPVLLGTRKEKVLSPIPEGYRMVWEDDFDGDALNPDNWIYRTGGWSASEVQGRYVESDKNVFVRDGALNLVATHEPGIGTDPRGGFASGFIESKGKQFFTYGYFEARIRTDVHNKSLWPAFWLSPEVAEYGSWPLSGEIDVVEMRTDLPSFAAADAHWQDSTDRKRHDAKVAPLGSRRVDDWHVYAVHWQENLLTFYVDGDPYHQISDFHGIDGVGPGSPFDIPFYIRLNLAVGGTYIRSEYADAYLSLADFPATMQVDWVRVWQP